VTADVEIVWPRSRRRSAERTLIREMCAILRTIRHSAAYYKRSRRYVSSDRGDENQGIVDANGACAIR
jgi:hypothetical protein